MIKRSIILVSTGVIDIGRKSARALGCVTFGTGLIYACFHCCGTVELAMDILKSCASGLEKIGAPSLRDHDGKESRPVAVGRRRSSALKLAIRLRRLSMQD